MPAHPEFDRDALSRLVRTSYDRVPAWYTERFANELDAKPFDRDMLERFAVRVAHKSLVCDVGCGPGHVGAYLRARGTRVCGVDLSPGMATAARRVQHRTLYAAGNMLALPIRDGALGGLMAFYSLIHLLRADMPQALREFARVCAPGAPVLCSVHGGTGEIYDEEAFDGQVPMYATLFSLEEITQAVRDAGMTVEEAVQREPYPAEYPTPRVYVLARRA